jgi:hypothetical protein
MRRGNLNAECFLHPKSGLIKELWLKAAAAGDPAEVESLLWEFRNALHEHIEKLRAEGQNLRTG